MRQYLNNTTCGLLLCLSLATHASFAQAYRPHRVYRPVSSGSRTSWHLATPRQYYPTHSTGRSSYKAALAQPSYPAFSSPSSNYSSRHPRSVDYRLGAGDLLAVIVNGILGDFESAPVHTPAKSNNDVVPSTGYPVPVRADGTIDLPHVDLVSVQGLTVREAQEKIERVYRHGKMLNRKHQVMASLMRKRTVSMTVIHDEPINAATLSSPYFAYSSPRKRVSNVTLAVDQADRLTALGQAGAAFDLDAEIISVDRFGRRFHGRDAQSPNVSVVEARLAPVDFFYTGGFLPANRLPIPKRGLTVAQAVALSGGSIGQRPFGASDLYVVRNARENRHSAQQVDMLGPNSSVRDSAVAAGCYSLGKSTTALISPVVVWEPDCYITGLN